MQRDGYREAIEAAGFEIETWRQNTEYRFVSERADNATQKYGVTSISLLAPSGLTLSAQLRDDAWPSRSARSSAGADSSVRHSPSRLSSSKLSNAE